MKNKFIIITSVVAIALVTGFFFFELQQQKDENTALIQTAVQAELSKALPKTQTNVVTKDTAQGLTEKNVAFQRKIDSLNLSFKILSKVPKAIPQDKQRVEQEKQKQAFLTYAAIKAQIKADSLENVVKELTSLVKSNIILANQVQSKQLVTDSPKTVKQYYDNVSIIFRTRQTFITAKVDEQRFSNFQYGQVFHFEKTIPDYMTAFVDSKGASISNEAARKFLQEKAFWVNSIDLKNHNAVVKCSQNM